MNRADANQVDDAVRAKLSVVRLLAMDVDGVLTDGSIGYDDAGHEQKRFHVADGLGLVALRHCEVEIAWLSGRRHTGVERRAAELGIVFLQQGVRDKQSALIDLADSLQVDLDHVAYIGDDWNDLPALEVVGCPISVANGVAEVKAAVVFVTRRSGGNGAVREVCEAILDAKGQRAEALNRYLNSLKAPIRLSGVATM